MQSSNAGQEQVEHSDDHAHYQMLSREEWRRAAYEPLLAGVVLWDVDGRLAYANPAAEEILGATLDQLRGRDAASVFQAAQDENGPPADTSIAPAHAMPGGLMSLLRHDGERRWVQVRTVAVHDPQGEVAWRLSSFIDQSAISQTEEALRIERGLLHTLMDTSPDLIYVKDRDSRFTRINKAHAAYLGLSDPAEAIGKTDFDFYGETAQSFFAEEQRLMTTGQPLVGAIEEQSELAQRSCWVQSTKVPIVQAGQITGLVGISRDITELKLVQEQLAHQALHDSLTGLPNRALLHDRLEQALRTAERASTPLALFLLDLDRFKEVNDTLGHQYGDLLLREVAARVRQALRDSDTLARLGGDEFAMVLPEANIEGAIATAGRIRQVLAEPLDLAGHHPDVAGSIGIALFPLHGTDTTSLLAHADVAMYAAKQAGGGYAIYDATLDEHSPDHLALPQEFREALANGELFLHYQPLIDLCQERVTTVEALLRWPHPRHGLIPPMRFLPLAERIGALGPLTRWVLNAALRQCHAWQQGGLFIRVAVNISPRTLQDPELPAMVAHALHEHSVDPASLTLEITEDALLVDPEQALGVLAHLGQLGVRIAIDDFGTGFSSMAYLKRLPVHEIKIDKSFVLGMKPGERDEAIVRSVIELGHNLGLAVVAEGIEDETTLRRLAELNCDSGQGYLVSHPVPAADLEQWVQSSGWSTGSQ